ncbi:MAG TPA: gamma-glutamylcyclotransferase, partial [Lachnoclostridium sp.]|nr:gamma-glutamylcyclotransferase [Lachnoclostridium sp.]
MSKKYIAYGSNLSVEQMAFRCPEAKIIGMAAIQ